MADAFRLCANPFRFTSEFLLTDFTSSLKSNPSAIHFCPTFIANKRGVCVGSDLGGGFGGFGSIPRKQFASLSFFLYMLNSLQVHATVAETDQPKWWEKNAGPNMIDIHSTQEFLGALSQAGDRLVIVEFYGTWCASCRALFPKLCKTAQEHPEILFLKVNFDENKPMCKSLNVKVLPYFHFYRGVDGLVESFSCSLAKFQKIKDAIETHNKARDCIGPPKGVGDLRLEVTSIFKDKPAGSSSSSSS